MARNCLLLYLLSSFLSTCPSYASADYDLMNDVLLRTTDEQKETDAEREAVKIGETFTHVMSKFYAEEMGRETIEEEVLRTFESTESRRALSDHNHPFHLLLLVTLSFATTAAAFLTLVLLQCVIIGCKYYA